MPQSLAQIYIHLIFSTKKRQRWFQDPTLNDKLITYLGGTLRNLGCPLLSAGVPQDHVHLLLCMNRTDSVANVVGKLKAASSSWISGRPGDYQGFSWQNGYGAFSVSASGVEEVENYIANQIEHHKTISFKDEYRKFLEKYNVGYDERYVWD